MFQLTPIVKNILIINAVLLLLETIVNISLAPIFGVHSLYSDQFFIFQYVSYMWLHAGLWHLIGNMIVIFFFGPMLERIWGPKRFLTFYLIVGIGAGLIYGIADLIDKNGIKNDAIEFSANPNPDDFYIYIQNYGEGYDIAALTDIADTYFDNAEHPGRINEAVMIVNKIYDNKLNNRMIGASGAVFGVLLAFAILFPNTEIMLLFLPVPIKAKYLVFAYGSWEIYSEIFKKTGDNISHITHLGGIIVAFIVLKVWQKQRGDFY
ncbi:MAG: rhomboid family intramembrane serine protease [Reichenbachiella sp.]|uniref:rhomboid family intramembrane serine protease n=1 Tax=Reichenbachiella sp. TaxID=2184521 RepID=UPI003263C743